VSDYKFGKSQEISVMDKVNNYFKDNIIHIEDKYSKWDYKGDKYCYELKSRTNNYKSYPTTMFPVDKVVDDLIILINFLDGLYYIKYDKKVFDTFEIKSFKRNDRSDHKDVKKDYFYIPIGSLSKIE